MVNKTFLQSAIKILHHYGFENFEMIQAASETKSKQTNKQIKLNEIFKKLEIVSNEEKDFIRNLKLITEKSLHTKKAPTLLYHITNPKANSPASLQMHILGANSTIAEMMLILAVVSSLRQSNINEYTVFINSLGSQESKEKFIRDLKTFFKKHDKFIPKYAKKLLEQKQYIKALKLIREKDEIIVSTAPSPIDYLSNEDRIHLRDIFEFLEYADIPYELSPLLVGSTELWSKTLFEIKINKKGEQITVARGGRYTDITKKILGKKIEIVGVKINLGNIKNLNNVNIPKRQKSPKIFLSYIGPIAQIKALKVLDNFYNAGIPILNSFLHASLIEQMKKIKEVDIPYVIIIGHKEAINDSAIVKNINTNTQKVIPLNKLNSYISRLKL